MISARTRDWRNVIGGGNFGVTGRLPGRKFITSIGNAILAAGMAHGTGMTIVPVLALDAPGAPPSEWAPLMCDGRRDHLNSELRLGVRNE